MGLGALGVRWLPPAWPSRSPSPETFYWNLWQIVGRTWKGRFSPLPPTVLPPHPLSSPGLLTPVPPPPSSRSLCPGPDVPLPLHADLEPGAEAPVRLLCVPPSPLGPPSPTLYMRLITLLSPEPSDHLLTPSRSPVSPGISEQPAPFVTPVLRLKRGPECLLMLRVVTWLFSSEAPSRLGRGSGFK